MTKIEKEEGQMSEKKEIANPQIEIEKFDEKQGMERIRAYAERMRMLGADHKTVNKEGGKN